MTHEGEEAPFRPAAQPKESLDRLAARLLEWPESLLEKCPRLLHNDITNHTVGDDGVGDGKAVSSAVHSGSNVNGVSGS